MRVTWMTAAVQERAAKSPKMGWQKPDPRLERLKLEVQPGAAVQRLQRHKAAAKVRLAVAKLTGG